MTLRTEIENFLKLAQTFSTDSSLPDSIKQLFGQKILNDASQFLNTKAVSSIPVVINYQKPQASFEIDATGQDAPTVNQELKKILDQKYSGNISRLINSKDKNATSFKFNLMTVE